MKVRKRMRAALEVVNNAAHSARVHAALGAQVNSHRDRHPAFAEWTESDLSKDFAVFALRERWRVSMRALNPMERAVLQELKRMTMIISGFPNERSPLRLCTAVMMQSDEKRASGKTLSIRSEEVMSDRRKPLAFACVREQNLFSTAVLAGDRQWDIQPRHPLSRQPVPGEVRQHSCFAEGVSRRLTEWSRVAHLLSAQRGRDCFRPRRLPGFSRAPFWR